MMAITGLSVGFDAKAPVRDLAGVLIDDRDLSQVLPLLGLRGRAAVAAARQTTLPGLDRALSDPSQATVDGNHGTGD